MRQLGQIITIPLIAAALSLPLLLAAIKGAESEQERHRHWQLAMSITLFFLIASLGANLAAWMNHSPDSPNIMLGTDGSAIPEFIFFGNQPDRQESNH